MDEASAGVVRSREQVAPYRFAGMDFEVRVLVSSADTGGAQAVTEFTFERPFEGPPLHWHRSYAETFVCLEGTCTVRFEHHEEQLVPGDVAYIPPGTLHSYRIEGASRSRYLLVCSPSGDFDKYVADAAAIAAEFHRRNAPVDMELLRAIRGRYQTYEADVSRF
jgi:quercetin dioxygenase-like cupin family protein